MISINIHPVASMKIKVAQLNKCVTLTLSSDGNEVVYFLKTVEDAREIVNTIHEALDETIKEGE